MFHYVSLLTLCSRSKRMDKSEPSETLEEFDREAELKRILRKFREINNTVIEAQNLTRNGSDQLTDGNIKFLRKVLKEILPKVRDIEILCIQTDFNL